MQLTGLMTILSGTEDQNELVSAFGWGVTFSAILNSWQGGKWYFHASGGQGVTRYFNDLSEKGLDLIINPATGREVLPFAIGSFLTYEHRWGEKVFSNFTYGMTLLETFNFSPENSYDWGNTFRVNTFYSVIEGAQFGIEGILGERFNQGPTTGQAARFNFLVYYDF
jgi:hypothetical protein